MFLFYFNEVKSNIIMEQIEYTRTVVPSSMRSPYWKYFGFPSDSGNNILTRQKIVCTICNTAIAYNKNTSNLRTHLMSKHVEIFHKLVMTQSVDMATKQNININQNVQEQVRSVKERTTKYDPVSVNIINVGDIKRRRSEAHDEELKESLQSENHFVEPFLTIPEYNANLENESNIHEKNSSKIDLAIHGSEYIRFIPPNDSEIVEVSETSGDDLSPNCTNNEDVATRNEQTFAAYADVQLHEQQLHSMDLMLADMIQTDLLSLDILERYQGFCRYNQQLSGINVDHETVKRVMKVIETRFISSKQMITSHVARLSHVQPYSLSIEIYKDDDGQDVLNIYYNYLNDTQVDLISILYTSTVICSKSINISELLMDINLKNCSGVVVTNLDDLLDFVLEFTKCHELPLLECLESMLTRCLHKVFEDGGFLEDFKRLIELVLQNTSPQTNLNKSILRQRDNWGRLNCLEYIFQNIEQNELEQWSEMKRSFEFLKPLKMALDVITDEHLPLCTLTRPLIMKLFEEHFSSLNQEEPLIIFKIQTILQKELHERTMTQGFLYEATFFDTRFHRDFAIQEPIFDTTNLKTHVVKRFKHILQVTYINKPLNTKTEHNPTDLLMNAQKCSSLKSFFKRDVSLTNGEVSTDLKTNIDLEFEQYQLEECLDLDQSPALWWQQQADNYKQLSKVAKHYLTIPCCCLPRLCRLNLEQRYFILDRRKNLSQLCNIESKLWYLYYNDAVTELI